MKRGAADDVAKPFDHDELLITVKRILNHHLLSRQNAALKSSLGRDFSAHRVDWRQPLDR